MRHIRMTKLSAGPDGVFRPGDERLVSADEAAALAADGACDVLDAPTSDATAPEIPVAPIVAETATLPPVETATAAPQRGRRRSGSRA